MLLRRKGQSLLSRARSQGVPVFQVDEQPYDKLSDTETPQGVTAVVQKPVWRQSELLQRPTGLFLALDGLQDPGNLGAILRTGDGAGVDGVWLGHGTVDLYNPKVLRATMGSIFRIPTFAGVDLLSLVSELKARNVQVLAAVPHAGQSYFKADMKQPHLLLMIGNEARGISRSLLNLADQAVSVPLRPVVESLNAAVAAALLIYEVKRQRAEGCEQDAAR
jgi:TrmH family RNA methyltransferase